MFSLDRVYKVYAGAANRCMCGCTGKFTVASRLKEYADGDRGYAYDDSDVNDRTVLRVVNKILRSPNATINVKNHVHRDVESMYVTIGKRFYMAWLV